MAENKTLQAALWYIDHGYSIIPISPGTKIPPAGFKVEQYRKRLATRAEIESWWKEEPNYNIAIVTGALSDCCVVDHDCHKPEYKEDVAIEYFPDSLETPMSKTPAGGQHMYFRFPKDEKLTVNVGALPAIDFRGEGGYIIAPPSRNGGSGSYAWMEGYDIKTTALAPLPDQYINILKNSNKYNINKNNIYTEISQTENCNFKPGRRNDDFFHLAHSLNRGGSTKEFIWQSLVFINNSTPSPLPEKELKTIFESAMTRSAVRDRTIKDEVFDLLRSSEGLLSSPIISKHLQLTSKQDLKNINKYLHEAVEQGLIVKYGTKLGTYRVVDKDEELIDWEHADISPINVEFPLEVHKKVRIHKSNVIVIAGESNSGKTAFCLRTALMNKDRFSINYLSSEMNDGTELRIRLDQFEEPIKAWKGIKFQFRTDNFPDKIDPEGFNIIDYLDEGSDAEAYKMGMRIRQIADKLKGGIAVIAIQKAPNKDFGFGGAGTMNRARLYLTISPGVLKIVKGKIWATDKNPNGLSCGFKLVKGCRFSYDDNGYWE